MAVLRKTALSIALSAACGIAFAGGMGEVCTPENVELPCPSNAWHVTLLGLYAVPTGNTFNQYFAFNPTTNPISFIDFTPDWAWGSFLDLGYHYSNGKDVAVNWIYYRKVSHDYYDNVGFTNTPSADVKFDNVNLEAGQTVKYGKNAAVRYIASVQWAKISDHFNNAASNLAIDPLDNRDFSGVGPRFGFNASYTFDNGFGFIGNSSAALLIGNRHWSARTAAGVWAEGSHAAVSPMLDGLLGAKYSHGMGQGTLTVIGGYLAATYFNALPVGTGLGTPGQDINVSFHGPFIGLNWTAAA